ncbi:S-adenosylmethionine transporter [Oleoguttula sp. CCFEE 5521]
MEEHEVAQRQLSRKLEVLQDGFATIQTILDTRPSNPDDDGADETRIPFLPGHSRGASVATVATALSPEDYDFPQPPSRNSEDSATTATRSMHTANMSPPRRAPPVPPGTLRRDLLDPFSADFDLADPFAQSAASDPYASPLHHLLSMHESLREEMSRMATTLQELDGRHSMQMLNENIRSRDEVAHLGAQVAAIGRQVHWLTSTQLQRTQARGSAAQEGGAGPSNQYEDASAGAGIEAAVNAVSTAATALRGAARMVNAGALAGTTVDTSLFPLDTLKTRLQSAPGFFASGGFKGVYSGIGSAIVGSAPGAALFFVTYDSVKRSVAERNGGHVGAGGHMLAASLGEVAACAVRVPTEVVKQRAQAGVAKGSREALSGILSLSRTHGFGTMWRELYRGWSITVMREVPFTVIQFPLWEGMKRWSVSRRSITDRARGVSAGESAVYGSLSGAVAAGLTTPLDVLKTRLMLAKEKESVVHITQRIWRDEGSRAFFSGLGPRTMWISIGGAVFLGSYQYVSNALGGIA